MKVILLGNAGAGKSSLARQLIGKQTAGRLSLDEVAFQGGAERRPLDDSVAAARQFIARHSDWIIEGCYADIIEPLLTDCDMLIFLNPGVAICVEHCRRRPWEPEKFNSPEEQDANLANLIAWVTTYSSRDDEYGLQRHRALFNRFNGRKLELTDPRHYATAVAS
ncbi:MAG: shikimate kinase [Marinobacter sp.]|nr:shikimate kinase [Marinobacter sp.]